MAEIDEYSARVLDVVDAIPAGQVMSYGDVAEYLGAGGPRQVGRVMDLSERGTGMLNGPPRGMALACVRLATRSPIPIPPKDQSGGHHRKSERTQPTSDCGSYTRSVASGLR